MLPTSAIFVALLAVAPVKVSAHGWVKTILFGTTTATAWNFNVDPYMNPVPSRITRKFNSDGPVTDVTSKALTCNTNGGTMNEPAPLTQAGVVAGQTLKFTWNTWPTSHLGPVMTYMANCNGDCAKFDGSNAAAWFKIQEAGLQNGEWALTRLINNGFTWTTKIPTTIKSGNYLLRHELLALHSAGGPGGAQFYPSCNQIAVTSSGTLVPKGVALPGYYKATDPGILYNLYNGTTTYYIPGPPLIAGGQSGF